MKEVIYEENEQWMKLYTEQCNLLIDTFDDSFKEAETELKDIQDKQELIELCKYLQKETEEELNTITLCYEKSPNSDEFLDTITLAYFASFVKGMTFAQLQVKILDNTTDTMYQSAITSKSLVYDGK